MRTDLRKTKIVGTIGPASVNTDYQKNYLKQD